MLATYPKYSKNLHEQCPLFLAHLSVVHGFVLVVFVFSLLYLDLGTTLMKLCRQRLRSLHGPQIVARTYPIMYCRLGVYMHAYVYSNAWLSRELAYSGVLCSAFTQLSEFLFRAAIYWFSHAIVTCI